MTRSPGLWLYLFVARRQGRGAGAETIAFPAPRGGEVLWFHACPGTPLLSLAHLARQMARARPGLSFVVTAPGAVPDLTGFPEASLALPLPADRLADLGAFFDHFRPSLLLLTGLALPPALIHLASERRVPLVLADVHLSAGAKAPWHWTRRMAAALLSHFDLILARDKDSAAALSALVRRSLKAEVTGRIEETTEPLPHSETEREDLAELLQARPVWLAAACPAAEEEAVIAAQARALRYAHRMLLILAPADPGRGQELAERLAADGMTVALRSLEEDPEDDVQVLVADTDGEMGLWYRLAPVTYMGGTLTEAGTGRNPIEPAALGSAILHGPHPGPYPEAYARLGESAAARRVANAEGLAEAVTDLIAPDKAALLAHNAWAASSGGAEVTERVTQMLFARMDAAKARSAAAIAKAGT